MGGDFERKIWEGKFMQIIFIIFLVPNSLVICVINILSTRIHASMYLINVIFISIYIN